MTSAEILARKAVWNQFRASFNLFADAYNAAQERLNFLLSPDEYIRAREALRRMSDAINAAAPAVTEAIDLTNSLPVGSGRPTFIPKPGVDPSDSSRGIGGS